MIVRTSVNPFFARPLAASRLSLRTGREGRESERRQRGRPDAQVEGLMLNRWLSRRRGDGSGWSFQRSGGSGETETDPAGRGGGSLAGARPCARGTEGGTGRARAREDAPTRWRAALPSFPPHPTPGPPGARAPGCPRVSAPVAPAEARTVECTGTVGVKGGRGACFLLSPSRRFGAFFSLPRRGCRNQVSTMRRQ